jgi:hypothetical protein
MRRSHRAVHRWLWLALAFAIGLGFAMALVLRPVKAGEPRQAPGSIEAVGG